MQEKKQKECIGKCNNCTLLTDRLAEERKSVVQEIKSKSYGLKNTPMYNEYGEIIGTFNRLDYGKLEKILDQVERGE